MFFFQTPFLPEMMMKAEDFHFLTVCLKDYAQGGARNPEAFSKEDLEAWKYTFGQPGVYGRESRASQIMGGPLGGEFESKIPE